MLIPWHSSFNCGEDTCTAHFYIILLVVTSMVLFRVNSPYLGHSWYNVSLKIQFSGKKVFFIHSGTWLGHVGHT